MRAVIYCRVSTKEQTKNLSLPAQRKASARFCKEQGWVVDRVFVERGESAKTRDRTELKRLMDHCRKNRGRLHVVVVYSLDRLARSNHDHFAIRAFLAGLSGGDQAHPAAEAHDTRGAEETAGRGLRLQAGDR